MNDVEGKIKAKMKEIHRRAREEYLAELRKPIPSA